MHNSHSLLYTIYGFIFLYIFLISLFTCSWFIGKGLFVYQYHLTKLVILSFLEQFLSTLMNTGIIRDFCYHLEADSLSLGGVGVYIST